MPYSSLPTVASGETIDPAWGNLVDTNLDFLANPPACRVYNNANISTTSGVDQALTFNTENVDTDLMHSTSVNTNRITINTAGLYVVHGNVQFAASATGARTLYFKVNGTTFYNAVTLPNNGATVLRILVTDVIKLAANDYVELYANQTSGGALDVQAFGNTPSFSAVRIGTG